MCPRMRTVLLPIAILIATFAAVSGYQKKAAPKNFVDVKGNDFVLNGCPYFAVGANNYYLGYSSQFMVRSVTSSASSLGLNIVRTFGFLAGDEWQQPAFYYKDRKGKLKVNHGGWGLGLFDTAIMQAKQRGVRLIVVLSNNWLDNGIAWFTKNFGGTYHDDFYSNSNVRYAFKTFIREFLTHKNRYTGVQYRDEPQIIMWELINEPRCITDSALKRSPNCDGNKIYNWVREMAAFVKTIDSKHLLGIGDEGFFSTAPYPSAPRLWPWRIGTEAMDWRKGAQIPEIDVLTFHFYLEQWLLTPRQAEQWVRDHMQIGNALGKPVIFEEYGVRNRGIRSSLYLSMQNIVRQSGGAGTLVWTLAGEVNPGQMYPDYDGYTLYNNDESRRILKDHASALKRISQACKDRQSGSSAAARVLSVTALPTPTANANDSINATALPTPPPFVRGPCGEFLDLTLLMTAIAAELNATTPNATAPNATTATVTPTVSITPSVATSTLLLGATTTGPAASGSSTASPPTATSPSTTTAPLPTSLPAAGPTPTPVTTPSGPLRVS